MNKLVVDWDGLHAHFNCHIVNLSPPQPLQSLGKFSVAKLAHAIALVARISRALVAFRPTAVYFTLAPHGYAFYRDLTITVLIRTLGIRRIYHLHGKGIATRWRRNLILRFVYRVAFSGARVIVLSERLRDDIKGLVDPSYVYIVPNGIADPYFGERKYSRDHIGPVRILFLSNLIESKGPIVLLEALRRLKDHKLPFRAWFAGNPFPPITEAKFVSKVQDLELTHEVQYLGAVYGADKRDLLLSSDILALPTYYENEAAPLVILEGMAASLAIVSTYEGGIPDMITNDASGVVVPPRDVSALTDALLRLGADKLLRARLGAVARERFVAEFTMERFRERLIAVLQTCCGDPDREFAAPAGAGAATAAPGMLQGPL